MGPFETSAEFPPLRFLTDWTPGTVVNQLALTVRWTGGDPNDMLRLSPFDYPSEWDTVVLVWKLEATVALFILNKPLLAPGTILNPTITVEPANAGTKLFQALGFQRTVSVGPDGSFALSELPAGRYSLCAYGSQPRQVSGCAWEGVPAVELAAGQKLQNNTRKVLNGTLVTFRVADPQGRIASPDSYGNIASKRHFFIGVAAGTYYMPANPVSVTAKERVPKQQHVKIFVDTDLNVTDPAGVALERKRPTSAQIAPAGRDTVTVDLSVN